MVAAFCGDEITVRHRPPVGYFLFALAQCDQIAHHQRRTPFVHAVATYRIRLRHVWLALLSIRPARDSPTTEASHHPGWSARRKVKTRHARATARIPGLRKRHRRAPDPGADPCPVAARSVNRLLRPVVESCSQSRTSVGGRRSNFPAGLVSSIRSGNS